MWPHCGSTKVLSNSHLYALLGLLKTTSGTMLPTFVTTKIKLTKITSVTLPLCCSWHKWILQHFRMTFHQLALQPALDSLFNFNAFPKFNRLPLHSVTSSKPVRLLLIAHERTQVNATCWSWWPKTTFRLWSAPPEALQCPISLLPSLVPHRAAFCLWGSLECKCRTLKKKKKFPPGVYDLFIISSSPTHSSSSLILGHDRDVCSHTILRSTMNNTWAASA